MKSMIVSPASSGANRTCSEWCDSLTESIHLVENKIGLGEVIGDIKTTMLREKSFYRFNRNYTREMLQTETDGRRLQIARWYFVIVDHFEIDREIVSLALFYLSCSMTCSCGSTSEESRSDYRRLAVSALYLAIKLHHPYHEILSTKDFAKLSRNTLSAEDIAQGEFQILSLLDWKLHPPTPIQYISHFIRLFPRKLPFFHGVPESRNQRIFDIFEIAQYLCEMACLSTSPDTRNAPGSTTAFAALFCAIQVTGPNEEDSMQVLSILEREVDDTLSCRNAVIQRIRYDLQSMTPDLFGHLSSDMVDIVEEDWSEDEESFSLVRKPHDHHNAPSPTCALTATKELASSELGSKSLASEVAPYSLVSTQKRTQGNSIDDQRSNKVPRI